MIERLAWCLTFLPLPVAAGAAESDADLPTRGCGVLQKYWFACHADGLKYPELDLRDRETLLRPRDHPSEFVGAVLEGADERPRRTPPQFWEVFVLSGRWR